MTKKKAEIKIYDIESYPNLFTFVAKTPGSKEYDVFVIFKDVKGEAHINQSKELLEYLKTPGFVFVGFNNLSYDGPMIEEFILNKGEMSPARLHKLSQDIIDDVAHKVRQWDFKTKQIDLYTMWSFDTAQRRCSLKWLEFTMRMKKLKDLPYHFNKVITARQVKDVVTYNKYDVDVTEALFMLSEDKLQLRKTLYEMYGQFSFFSRGDTSLGADTFLIDLAEEMGISVNDLKKKRTFYDKLHLKDIILEDRLTFMSKSFKDVLDYYKGVTLYANEDGLLDLEGAITRTVEFDGIEFKYGTGGLHASVNDKIIIADEDHDIVDVDVASFYPNLAINNGLHPKHLSSAFVKKYKGLYEERKLIPKSDPLNLSKKLSLNSIFGKSNSKYSYLFDPAFTLGITINGQLQLSMLAEQLARCSKIIQVNTDGVTVMVHKTQRHLVDKVIEWWQKKTDLELEAAEYSRMVISDVNNYHATYTDGSVKRKGKYMVYSDYTNDKSKDYHKNPSATVLAQAIDSYFMKDVPVRDTVYNEQNIHEFMFGFKKKSNFDFVLAIVKENGYISLAKNSDRVIRYYVAQNGASLYKLNDSYSFTALNKNTTVLLGQMAANSSVDRYPMLDKEFYVSAAQEWLDSFEKVDNKQFVKGKIIKKK